ncbi:uncharacterized protein LOC124929847 [Impatiens glandulifera]|uniref:uncharacterized protein LOC124929847 n=1 Tax=Impatiens glandulifera TaxID=253017 RepID=UPI001FB1939A|nr:uncharacterized protein LOC124929847 [Impatiens glandulifera]
MVVHISRKSRDIISNTILKRDTMKATSNAALENHLAKLIQDQMLLTSSDELQKKETLDSLSKDIRSSISKFLYGALLDQVYLFHGVSNNLLFKLELVHFKNEVEEIVGEVIIGDPCGEISILCNKPQVFTVRTKQFSQLLKMNGTKFLNIIRADDGDNAIINSNLFKHLKKLNGPNIEGRQRLDPNKPKNNHDMIFTAQPSTRVAVDDDVQDIYWKKRYIKLRNQFKYNNRNRGMFPDRVAMIFPEIRGESGTRIKVPHTFEELFEIAYRTYGVYPSKILSRDGDIEFNCIDEIMEDDILLPKPLYQRIWALIKAAKPAILMVLKTERSNRENSSKSERFNREVRPRNLTSDLEFEPMTEESSTRSRTPKPGTVDFYTRPRDFSTPTKDFRTSTEGLPS